MTTLWQLLLLALLQNPTDTSDKASAARDFEMPDAVVEIVPLDELAKRVSDKQYVPVPLNQVAELIREDRAEAPASLPRIREARYSATLNATRLDQAQLEFETYSDSTTSNSGLLLLGQTSLQQLKIFDEQGPIELGSDSSRRLFLLEPGFPGKLTGTWTSDGLVAGDVVTFRLELPAATTSRFELLTKPGIVVSSASSLVLGPETVPATPETSELKSWTILPGDTTRLNFNCREQKPLHSMTPMPLMFFNAAHELTGDILKSRWTIGLPPELNGRSRLTARVSNRVRIADVMLEDRRPVEWQVTEENGQQTLSLLLPEASDSATLNVSAASVLPQTESWDLPMLSLSHWFSSDDSLRGPILVPIGQISVVLPRSVYLDEWTLVGIQERDIVTKLDQSRDYQLIQFQQEASAIARTSSSEPRLSDSVVTLVEPAGRLATVRCLVNVACEGEGASVVELQWPISQGWQVIAARYASNSRSLFFEFPQSAPEAATSPLTLHLPESLEPGASRVVEIQLRQSDAIDARTINLPLGENKLIERTNSVVVFPPALTLSTELQRRWSAGRRPLTLEEVRKTTAWLPESKLTNVGGGSAAKFFAAGGAESTPLARSEVAETSNQQVIELEHAVRIVEGQIVETSRIVLPANHEFGESLTLQMPSQAANSSRWSLDGEPIPARRGDLSGNASPADHQQTADQNDHDSNWEQWTISLVGRRSSIPSILRCESRQPASQEIIATIPVPKSDLAIEGTLRLFSSEEGQLTVTDLIPAAAENPIDATQDNPSTNWKLPTSPKIVPLVLKHNPGIQFGQTIDVHMLHMIDEHSGGLNQQVLAVANVSRSAGRDSLPLALPTAIRPLVLVNGHRVQLQTTAAGFSIPLPVSSVDCQVVLTWNEPGDKADDVTGKRELPRLFLRELSVPQCTHHLLVNRQLELRAPGAEFAATVSTDVMRILDRLMTVAESSDGTSRRVPVADMPAEIRSFISRWQLATTQNWDERTIIDSVQSGLPIVVQVTQLRRRTAISAGMILLLVACCIFFRNKVMEYRVGVSLVACGLLGVSVLMPTSIAEAMITGAFWGLLAGLTFVTATRWQWLRTISIEPLVRLSMVAWLLTLPADFSAAQESARSGILPQGETMVTAKALLVGAAADAAENDPDVLLPETPLPDSDIAYVKAPVFEKWQKKHAAERAALPAAVVKSLQMEIVAESVESIELIQKMEVAAVSGDKQCHIRVPLSGSRLVMCTINGEKVFPVPDGPDAILIPVPASSLLPTRSLSGADDGKDKSNSTTAVDAWPLAAFTVHQIECRLRPVITRQTSGLQFLLPALPCPFVEIKLTAPDGLFTGVRAQTAAGVVQWKPTEGAIQFNGLAMSEGIDIRLFQTNLDKGSPQLATVETLTIAEVVAEQPMLSCICRFTRWNPLTPEVRYMVPQGYQLISASSVNSGDLLWSVQDRVATILLPNAIGSEFILSLQLKSDVASPLHQRRIPIAELGQFSDCVPSPNLVLAARVNPVFSVLPIEGNQITTLAFSDIQPSWGQWLQRSDSVFSVPSGTPECIVHLTARKSLNEIKIKQNFALRNQRIDWTCQIDIETLVLPVFRHRLMVNSDIEITDVQVNAGESNRKASWHRRGDRLVVQLKEGTIGRHILKISGRQLVRPDDTQIALHSPHVHDAHVLESIMELTDLEGLGMEFEKLGTAVPTNKRIATSDPLQPGTPVVLQILNEADPVVLRRLRPVKPVGSIAVLRSADQVAIIVHLSQWAGSLGPLAMKFPEDSAFLTEPMVIVDHRQLPLIRNANEFTAGPDVIPELFNQPDFAIVWSVAIPESQRGDKAVTFGWPEISDRIMWTERLMIPLENTTNASNTAANATIPPWLKDFSAIAFGNDLATLKRPVLRQAFELPDPGKQLTVPVDSTIEEKKTETARPLFAVSNSTLWSNPNQSAVGQTTLAVFTPVTPGRCTIAIPRGTVVTELETTEAIRWEDTARERVTVELTKPVTIIRVRWMSTRARNGFASTTLEFAVPFPVECETECSLILASSEGERPQFLGDVVTVPETELEATLLAELSTGLRRAQPDVSEAATTQEPLLDAAELAAQLARHRTEFLSGFIGNSRSFVAKAICLPTDNSRIQVFIRKRLQWQTLISIAAGFLAVAGAVFGQTMRSAVSESTTRIATQSSSFQRSGSKSQTNANGQLPTGESAISNTTRPPQN